MEAQNFLGIYIGRSTAAVVCLSPQGQNYKTIGCFSVSGQGKEEQNLQMLATLIAQGCAERGLEFSEAAVAFDCAMFMPCGLKSQYL